MPAISPDGSQVAYVSTRRGEHPDVWTMKIDGSAPLQLTSNDSPDHQPSWSRDGRRVVYKSRRDKTLGLWASDVETRREAPIMTLAGAQQLPGRLGETQISQSMTQIAFSILTPPTGKRAIYVTGTDRYAARIVNTSGVSVGYPVWSPDDRCLAVEVKDDAGFDESASVPDGSVQAGLLDVATGRLRMLTDERGQTLRLGEWRGSAVAITFIYTRCPLPQYCPMLDRRFAEVQRLAKADPTLAGRVRLLSVSFDPDADTPPILAAHAAKLQADPTMWRFATAPRDEVDRFAVRFGINVIRESDGTITHNMRTAVIDPAGRVTQLLDGSQWTAGELLAHLRSAASGS